MGRCLSDQHVLWKVRLVDNWIKRKEKVNGARIRSEKLREHQYMEGYARYESRNVEEIWE